MIKTVATIMTVERRTTKAGKQFAVVRDTEGREFTSWTDTLTLQSEGLQGQKVLLGYDETTKGQYTNRTLKLLEEAGGDSVPGPVGGAGGAGASAGTGNQIPSAGDTARYADGDWLSVVRDTARRGEWRAAEALLRRHDIARSVALNNTITFFQYLAEDNRKPENVKMVFDYMLKALEEE